METLDQLAKPGVVTQCPFCKARFTPLAAGTTQLPDCVECPDCHQDLRPHVIQILRRRRTSTGRFEERWGTHFDAEPWWESVVAQHEYVGDWDGPYQLAIETLVYDLALARGLPLTFPCAHCGTRDDRVWCYECRQCSARDEEKDVDLERLEAERRDMLDARYANMSAAERAKHDMETDRVVHAVLTGLVMRDVP